MNADVRILVVDDSPVIRNVLKSKLDAIQGFAVVGTAGDPYVARDLIAKLRPQVITLDINMPRMDGITFLRKIMQYFPLPVIVLSSLTAKGSPVFLEALEAGALAVLQKPSEETGYSLNQLLSDLKQHIREAVSLPGFRIPKAGTPVAGQPLGSPGGGFRRRLIAMGASTGGTEALLRVLSPLPEQVPGIVIVQHMPGQFTGPFAQRLNRNCRIRVKEAVDGEEIQPGTAYVAPGGERHLLVVKGGTGQRIKLTAGPKVSGHRPSVDVLFESVARAVGGGAVGVILTGMGADGAAGLKRMHEVGAATVAQDEETCVVYGMPREAVRRGAVDESLPLEKIPRKILQLAATAQKKTAVLSH